MGWCCLILVAVVLMHHATLKPTPLDDLTVNLNLNDAPIGGHTFGSSEVESDEWKAGKKTNKDSSCTKKRNQREGQQIYEKRKRILGGKRYIPGLTEDVPDYENWMASIKVILDRPDGLNDRCGGVLISQQHVLTALHCIFDRHVDKFHSLDKVKIYFDPKNPDGLELWESVEFNADKYSFVKDKNGNPKYLDKSRKILNDDIAVIKLEKAVTDFQQTANLHYLPISIRPGKIFSHSCEYWHAGWGVYQLNPYEPSDFLQYTKNVPYIDCPKAKHSIRQDTMMCFMNTNNDGICAGDSGTPGVIKINNYWTLQSIHSKGVNNPPFITANCSEPKSISVDIDVYKYSKEISQWINE